MCYLHLLKKNFTDYGMAVTYPPPESANRHKV